MSQVKARDTKPELFVFKFLNDLKIRYKKHYKTYGKPDIAFPRKKIAVFIDGEFWHGRNFHNEKSSYKDFWVKKIGGNIKRDRKNRKILKKEGWKVIRIWDKDLKKNPGKETMKIIKALNRTTPE